MRQTSQTAIQPCQRRQEACCAGHKTGNWRDETGNWRDETGSWRDKTGSWRDETGSWRDETGSWRDETGSAGWNEKSDATGAASRLEDVRWWGWVAGVVKDHF